MKPDSHLVLGQGLIDGSASRTGRSMFGCFDEMRTTGWVTLCSVLEGGPEVMEYRC